MNANGRNWRDAVFNTKKGGGGRQIATRGRRRRRKGEREETREEEREGGRVREVKCRNGERSEERGDNTMGANDGIGDGSRGTNVATRLLSFAINLTTAFDDEIVRHPLL